MAVTFEQHIDIDATPDTVWGLITDPAKWPLWLEQREGRYVGHGFLTWEPTQGFSIRAFI